MENAKQDSIRRIDNTYREKGAECNRKTTPRTCTCEKCPLHPMGVPPMDVPQYFNPHPCVAVDHKVGASARQSTSVPRIDNPKNHTSVISNFNLPADSPSAMAR